MTYSVIDVLSQSAYKEEGAPGGRVPTQTLERTGDEGAVVHLELGERQWRQGEVARDQCGGEDWRSQKLCLGVRKWKRFYGKYKAIGGFNVEE